MPKRYAEAVWEGTLDSGVGKMRVGEGAVEFDYSYLSRFEDALGTNPEELLGAALCGSFCMALSALIADTGCITSHIMARAAIDLNPADNGYAIRRIALGVTADVLGMPEDDFQKLVDEAQQNCLVSQALTGAGIVVDATLSRTEDAL